MQARVDVSRKLVHAIALQVVAQQVRPANGAQTRSIGAAISWPSMSSPMRIVQTLAASPGGAEM